MDRYCAETKTSPNRSFAVHSWGMGGSRGQLTKLQLLVAQSERRSRVLRTIMGSLNDISSTMDMRNLYEVAAATQSGDCAMHRVGCKNRLVTGTSFSRPSLATKQTVRLSVVKNTVFCALRAETRCKKSEQYSYRPRQLVWKYWGARLKHLQNNFNNIS